MDLETQIRTVWEEVLQKDDFSNNDCIMDIGGNSMSIYKICAISKERFGLDIAPMDLFMYPSINDIIAHLNKSEASSPVQSSECNVVRRRLPRKR